MGGPARLDSFDVERGRSRLAARHQREHPARRGRAIYLPLTRLLNLYVSATQKLHKVSGDFLGTSTPKVPYIIGIAGSVAVGKSTFARILQALLARWPDHPKVDS